LKRKENTPPLKIPQRTRQARLQALARRRLQGLPGKPWAKPLRRDYRKSLKFFLGEPSTFTEAASNERVLPPMPMWRIGLRLI
jgi:hypothetical protein